jgi:hypothetical protein
MCLTRRDIKSKLTRAQLFFHEVNEVDLEPLDRAFGSQREIGDRSAIGQIADLNDPPHHGFKLGLESGAVGRRDFG